MWGVFKPGGAFELSHGKDTINDVAKFAENSVKAQNVWALSAEKILSILKRQNGKLILENSVIALLFVFILQMKN